MPLPPAQQRLALEYLCETIDDLTGSQTSVSRQPQFALGFGESTVLGEHIRQQHTRALVGRRQTNRHPQVLDALARLFVDPEDQAKQTMDLGGFGRGGRSALQQL
jgi:hypothetical protein